MRPPSPLAQHGEPTAHASMLRGSGGQRCCGHLLATLSSTPARLFLPAVEAPATTCTRIGAAQLSMWQSRHCTAVHKRAALRSRRSCARSRCGAAASCADRRARVHISVGEMRRNVTAALPPRQGLIEAALARSCARRAELRGRVAWRAVTSAAAGSAMALQLPMTRLTSSDTLGRSRSARGCRCRAWRLLSKHRSPSCQLLVAAAPLDVCALLGRADPERAANFRARWPPDQWSFEFQACGRSSAHARRHCGLDKGQSRAPGTCRSRSRSWPRRATHIYSAGKPLQQTTARQRGPQVHVRTAPPRQRRLWGRRTAGSTVAACCAATGSAVSARSGLVARLLLSIGAWPCDPYCHRRCNAARQRRRRLPRLTS